MMLTRGCGADLGSERTCLLNRSLDRPGSNRNLDHAGRRAGDSQHQGRGIAEIAVELDGPGSLRQLVVEGIQLEIDIAELFLGVFDAIVQLHVHQ